MIFADTITLIVNNREFDDVEMHLLESIILAWKQSDEHASNESARGDLRLSRWLEDNELTTELMSKHMKNIRSYGMVELMAKG